MKKIRLLTLTILLIASPISQLFDGPLPPPWCGDKACAFN